MILYGALGGTPLYLNQVQKNKSMEDNIKDTFLTPTGYLYEEPLFLLRQEVNQPGVYSAIIEAIARGASKANEIATKTGEESAKCIRYINTLCELGILYKETPFMQKDSSRRTLYGISDFMFRFWYRYVVSNKTLLETDAKDIVLEKKILPDLSSYMGIVFERICRDYLLYQNSKGNLPILFTDIGRWWGTDAHKREQVEIDLIAKDERNYLICECKWKNELLDYRVYDELQYKADVFCKDRENTWFVLFSKSGFTKAVEDEAKKDDNVILVTLEDLI